MEMENIMEQKRLMDVLGRHDTILVLALAADGGTSFSELSNDVGMANGTINRRLDELEQAGLIEPKAEVAENGRAVKTYGVSEDYLVHVKSFVQAADSLAEAYQSPLDRHLAEVESRGDGE